MQPAETRVPGTDYTISMDRERVDVGMVAAYLGNDSYWAVGRPAEVVRRSIESSTVFGAYDVDGTQAGVARLVTDEATFGWLCDVFVLDAHRGNGLGKHLVAAATTHADLLGLQRLVLATADAHDLYRPFGFEASDEPERWMYRPHPTTRM